MAEGTITLKEIIEDDALNWGVTYSKNLEAAIAKNKELTDSAIKLHEVYLKLQGVKTQKDFQSTQAEGFAASTKAAKSYEERLTSLNALSKERERQAQLLEKTQIRLLLSQEKNSKALIQERENLRKSNLQTKQNLTFMGQLEGARNRARQSVQDLNAKRALGLTLSKKEEIALNKSTKAFLKYDNSVKKIKENTKQFQENVGNYPKQFKLVASSLKSLIPLLSIGAGIKFAFDFAKESRDIAIQAKGIEFAFNKIGDAGVSAFEDTKKATRGLLSDIDIKGAIVEFDQFGIALEETDTLMEFVAVRASQTGKSFENLKTSLVEGLSKESKLRIDNLGISTADLNDELSKTPDFVQAVSNIARREIAKAGNILDDAANSQQKWNSDLKNFQLLVGNGLIAKASDTLYQFGSNILRMITPQKSLVKGIQDEQVELNVLVSKITDANVSNEERERLMGSLKEKYPSFLKFLKDEKTDNESLSVALKDINQQYIKRIALQIQQEKIEQVLSKAGEKAYDVASDQVEIEKELSRVNNTVLKNSLDLTNKSFDERVKIIKDVLEQNAKYIISKNGNFQASNREAVALDRINRLTKSRSENLKDQSNINANLQKEQEDMTALEIALGGTLEQINSLFKENEDAKKGAGDASEELTEAEKKALEKAKKLAAERRKLLKEDKERLEKAIIQKSIDNEKRLSEEQERSVGQRLLSNKAYFEESVKLLDYEKDIALKNAKGRKDELARIELAYTEDYKSLVRDRETAVEVILNDGFNKAKETIEKEKNLREESFNSRLLLANENLKLDLELLTTEEERAKRIEEYEKEILDIKIDSAKAGLEYQINAIEEELQSFTLTNEQKEDLLSQQSALKVALSDLETERVLDNYEKELQAAEKLAEVKRSKIEETSQVIADSLNLDANNLNNLITGIVDGFDSALEGIEAGFSVLGDVSSNIFDANISNIEAQLEESENFYNRQYELAEGDALKQDLIRQEQEIKRKELDEKLKKEKVKQAKADKAFSILQIGLSTAVAIMKAYAQLGPIAGSASATVIGILGAVQIAAVAAKPIPKYEKGTNFHPGGNALVGERRAEVIEEPGKSPYIISQPTILPLKRGTRVIASLEKYNKMRYDSASNDFEEQRNKIKAFESKIVLNNDNSDLIKEVRIMTKAIKENKNDPTPKDVTDFRHAVFSFNNIKWNK